MSEKEKQKDLLEKRSDRRTFLKNSGLTVGGIVLGGAVGTLIGNDSKTLPKETAGTKSTTENHNIALMYFTPEQFKVTEAAAERIFPADSNGPGAKELLVAYFIDHQLPGSWGLSSKEYTSGPYYPGEPTQGYQGRLNIQQSFDIGLQGLQDESLKRYEKGFAELSDDEQDAVLTDFADGKVALKGISSSYFFNLLRNSTIEGVYADPLYGGNANMEGWKMKNFPGHQMSYTNIIEKDEFVKIEPQSLNSQHNH